MKNYAVLSQLFLIIFRAIIFLLALERLGLKLKLWISILINFRIISKQLMVSIRRKNYNFVGLA